MSTPKHSDLRIQAKLKHVGVRRYLAERSVDGVPPEWAQVQEFGEGNGEVTLRAQGDDHIVGSIAARMKRDDVYISVIVDGFYEIGPDRSELKPEAEGESLLSRMSQPLQNGLAQRTSKDLYPFMRQAIHEASTKVLPTKGILLVPDNPQVPQDPTEHNDPHRYG